MDNGKLREGDLMVFELLATGVENATPKQTIMTITGLADRDLRRQVAKERRDGNPILTNVEGGGYYRPSCPAETEAFVRSMRRRAKETAAVARAVERTLMMELGQEEIAGWWDG